jgi:shikimate kinase
VILRSENRQLLQATGWIAWLKADPKTLWQRMQSDASTVERRPALMQGGLAEIEELMKVRQPLYSACANIEVDTEGRTPSEVAEVVLDRWREREHQKG